MIAPLKIFGRVKIVGTVDCIDRSDGITVFDCVEKLAITQSIHRNGKREFIRR